MKNEDAGQTTGESQLVTDDSVVLRGDSRRFEDYIQRVREVLGLDGDDTQPFITTTITSPPYGDLVDYGVANQIGYAQSESAYLADCQLLFEKLFRLTKDQGVLWVVADTYIRESSHKDGVAGLNTLPFVLSALAEQVGWTLREVIIWQKDKTRPWNHHGKLRNAFEYVLLLVKTPDFKFYAGRLRENNDLARYWVRYPERYNVFGKIPDNVWQIPIPTQGSWSGHNYKHACPLPPELVRRMLLLTTDEGDVVCDPFAGIGTVPAVAGALKRKGFGVELNPQFVESFYGQVRDELLSKVGSASLTSNGPSAETISSLRLLKYPKSLFAKLREVHPNLDPPSLIISDLKRFSAVDAKGSTVGEADWYFVFSDFSVSERLIIEGYIQALESVAPYTKYGVRGRIRVVPVSTARRILAGRKWHVYEHGRTWRSDTSVQGAAALSLSPSKIRGHFPPLVANVELSIDLQHVGDSATADG